MPEMLPYGLLLIALILATVVISRMIIRPLKSRNKLAHQSIGKRDWLPTGRIDFTTHINAPAKDIEKPTEFKLLVEERRIVGGVAGMQNVESRWRLAMLIEAKAVVTQYHKYLSENSLIKSIPDGSESPSLPVTVEASPSDSGA